MIIISQEIRNFLPHLTFIMLISMIDFVTLVRARFTKKFNGSTKKYCDDFSILVPIFGNMSYLKNIDFLSQYGDRVILCTTTKENSKFNQDINKIAKQNNFRIFRSEVVLASSRYKPNPWKLFLGALHGKKKNIEEDVEIKINKEIARDEIIRDSFNVVHTEYCIFLDGDTVAKCDVKNLVGTAKYFEYDLASVRVLASKKDTIMEKLQSVEYELAMDARKIYPWLTSGACMVAKTDVIKNIMGHHSLFFSGGDIENR